MKLSNLMLARAGPGARVVVIDWGLVKRADEIGLGGRPSGSRLAAVELSELLGPMAYLWVASLPGNSLSCVPLVPYHCPTSVTENRSDSQPVPSPAMDTASLPLADDTSSSLLTRAKNRDTEAWMQLVRWIGPLILDWCRRAGLQLADREEVSQQVLINIWRGLTAFRKDQPGHSFRGWVYTITRNCILDLHARNKRTASQPLPVAIPAESDPSDAQSLKRRALFLLVQEAVAGHASDRGFQAFYRTAVGGLSAVEVAAEMGMTADAVRQHKSRWVKRLRDQLREQFGELLD